MYRELVETYIQHNEYARCGRPCDAASIEKAEDCVGYPFPEDLKELLSELDGDRFLLMSVKQIIEHAKQNREILAGFFEDKAEFEEKVDRHIFFATNGCGDYYGYRVLPDGQTDASAIYIWEHETCEHRIVAKNIVDLIRKYYTDKI